MELGVRTEPSGTIGPIAADPPGPPSRPDDTIDRTQAPGARRSKGTTSGRDRLHDVLRQLLAHGTDGIVTLDGDGTVEFVSPPLCRLLGFDERELVGRPGITLVEPEDADVVRHLLDSGPTGASGPAEVRLRTSGTGGSRAFELVQSECRDDPDLGWRVWTLRDATEARSERLALSLGAEREQALAVGSSDVTLVCDALGLISYAGPSLEPVFGYRPDEVVGRRWADYVHPDDVDELLTLGIEVLEVEASASWNFRLRHADGTWRWVATRFRDLTDHPAVGGTVANIRDVTKSYLADQAAAATASLYRSIVETAEECITIHDLSGNVTFANPKMAALLGSTVEELQQGTIFDLVDPEDLEIASTKLAQRKHGVAEQYEFWLRAHDGSRRPVLISASPLRDAGGEVTGVLSMMTDISERKRAESESVWLSLHDPLTGLANRALVMDRMEQITSRHVRQPGLAAVLYMDLDNFKQVNDSLGHSAGDEVLCEVARRLHDSVRRDDTVGRFGGDEFVVLLDRLDTRYDALVIVERIIEAMAPAIDTTSGVVSSSLSLGIAFTPTDTAEHLLRDADFAMYRAKERGGACYQVFEDGLGARAIERLRFEADLRAAVQGDQIALHYQPVVTLDGAVTGFEALARWNHPVRGPVPPCEFIPVAESTGLIAGLGRFVLGQACQDLARWRRATGRDDLTVAVNLSGRQLAETGIVDLVADALRACELPPDALWIEMTESVLMGDQVTASAVLNGIHDLGVKLAVDDFGTGYSSLIYLRQFPVDALKLDRTFVAGVVQNPLDATIVRTVIDLAHSFGLVAVAEGVETSDQLDVLEEMGCDLAQGFIWSPAVPAGDAEAIARQGSIPPVGPT